MGGISHTNAVIQAPAFIGGAVAASGKTFFVNPNTSGARNAERPWYDVDGVSCFLTIQEAIDACVSDRGDIIYVCRGYNATTATTNFNKEGITVIGAAWGMGTRGRGEYFTLHSTHTDGPAARITKACHIYGLGFCGAQTSGDNYDASLILDGSTASADGYGTWLDNCYFTNWSGTAVDYGVYNLGVAAVLLSGCVFKGGATNPYDAGILHDESTTGGAGRPGNMDVIDCYFQDCTYAHEVVYGSRVADSIWQRNVMGYNTPGTARVKMLKLNSLAGGASPPMSIHMVDNYFGTAVGTGTFSHAQASLTTEGIMFSGNRYGPDVGILT